MIELAISLGINLPERRASNTFCNLGEMLGVKLRNEGEGRRILSVTDGRNLVGFSSKDEPSHRRRKRETYMFSVPISASISMLAPSRVPMMREPFKANFMLLDDGPQQRDIPSTGSLGTGSRNVLGEIGSGNNDLGKRDVVVGNVDDLGMTGDGREMPSACCEWKHRY